MEHASLIKILLHVDWDNAQIIEFLQLLMMVALHIKLITLLNAQAMEIHVYIWMIVNIIIRMDVFLIQISINAFLIMLHRVVKKKPVLI